MSDYYSGSQTGIQDIILEGGGGTKTSYRGSKHHSRATIHDVKGYKTSCLEVQDIILRSTRHQTKVCSSPYRWVQNIILGGARNIRLTDWKLIYGILSCGCLPRTVDVNEIPLD